MIRKSLPADAIELAQTLREADRLEIAALSGNDPLSALTTGLLHSSPCMTGVGEQGEVVAMFGVVPFADAPEIGAVWFLCSDSISKHVREIAGGAKVWVQSQLRRYAVLTNVVTDANIIHKRLIRHAGFTFGDPIENYGRGRVRVVPFYITGDGNV